MYKASVAAALLGHRHTHGNRTLQSSVAVCMTMCFGDGKKIIVVWLATVLVAQCVCVCVCVCVCLYIYC